MSAASRFPKAVVFDLDGTLVDSAPDIARAITAGFALVGQPPVSAAAVHSLVGGGAAVMMARAEAAYGIALSEADRGRVLERFFTVYREVSAEGNGLYPGAHELLAELRTRNVKTALCTNKADDVMRIAVKALGLADLFDVAVGANAALRPKPSQDMLLAALAPTGIAVADAVMVGDSRADAEAARAAGMPVILVDYGYTPTPVADLKPDAIVSRLADVMDWLPKLGAGR